MKQLPILGFWVFLGSSLLVAIAQYFHPATFAAGVLPLLVALACISGAIGVVKQRYE